MSVVQQSVLFFQVETMAAYVVADRVGFEPSEVGAMAGETWIFWIVAWPYSDFGAWVQETFGMTAVCSVSEGVVGDEQFGQIDIYDWEISQRPLYRIGKMKFMDPESEWENISMDNAEYIVAVEM